MFFFTCSTEISSIKCDEESFLIKLLHTYKNYFLPSIQKCLYALCPVSQMVKMLRLSVLEINKFKKSNKHMAYSELDMDFILKPISHLLIYPDDSS